MIGAGPSAVPLIVLCTAVRGGRLHVPRRTASRRRHRLHPVHAATRGGASGSRHRDPGARWLRMVSDDVACQLGLSASVQHEPGDARDRVRDADVDARLARGHRGRRPGFGAAIHGNDRFARGPAGLRDPVGSHHRGYARAGARRLGSSRLLRGPSRATRARRCRFAADADHVFPVLHRPPTSTRHLRTRRRRHVRRRHVQRRLRRELDLSGGAH